ncbi:non-ribosomal peptide synthetase [Streptomyces sp. 796.1]|uniref:non-ribosomal peptide synthetase n=1 Tax=Streptomyces sp. 796.1 TaxID=3163029 RepID=UPI0039C8C0CE
MTTPSASPAIPPNPDGRVHVGAATPLPALLRPLWFASRMAAGSAQYNEPAAFLVSGPLDVAALRRALDTVYRNQAALRTVVTGDDRAPQVVFAPAGRFPLTETDLREHGPRRARELAVETAAAEARHPFDLDGGPLVRGRLLRCADQEWLLVVVLHHLICDGYALGLLFAEIGAAYAGNAGPAPAVDVLTAQHELATAAGDAERAADRAYWARQLADVPARMALPTDRQAPAAAPRSGRRIPIPLPSDWFATARAAASELRTPPFAVALAALGRTVGALADTTDVVIGTTVGVRAEAEAEDTIGYFLKTVPLRLHLPPERTVGAAVRHAHEVVLAAMAHTSCEFDDIVAAAPASDAARPELLQVALELQYAVEELELTGTSTSRVPLHTGAAKSDLTFHLNAAPGAPSELEYATELYEESTAHSLAAAFATLVTGVRAGGDARQDAVPLDALPLDELPFTDRTVRGTVEELARGVPLPELPWTVLPAAVRARALHHPERPAVVADPADGGPPITLTYAELVAHADVLAGRLVAAGVRRGAAVGILARNAAVRIAAVFGVWQAGAVCVTLDPDLPARRLRHMVAAVEVRVLVVEEGQDDAFAPPELPRLHWTHGAPSDVAPGVSSDAAPGASPGPSSGAPTATAPAGQAPGPDDTAYVIFTSGSSGTPKAVAVRHGSLAAFAEAMHRLAFARLASDAGPPLRVAQNAPPSFDASWQSVLMLGTGHTLYPVPSALRLDGKRFVSYLRDHRIDLLDATPTHAQHLVDSGLLEPGPAAPRLLVLGGEAVPQGLWTRLSAGPVRAVNVYGPTEFTVNATGCAIDADHPRPTIGRPLAGVTARVLDRRLRPVPPGFPGELYLSGPQLAIGYHGRPDLTAERFIATADTVATAGTATTTTTTPGTGPSTGTAVPGERAYATGDLARWLPDGTLEFLGRRDDQVKLRGHRIELGEVAETLRAAPLVADAAATVLDTGPAGPVLVGALVPAGPGLATDAVRDFAAERLPRHLVPAAYHVLEALPCSAAGKLDRSALHTLIAAAHTAPTANQETTSAPADSPLAGLWRELLQRESVRADDDFFALGGHSLLATHLAREAQAKLGVRLPLRIIFEHRTLAAMEAAIADREPPPGTPAPSPQAPPTSTPTTTATPTRARTASAGSHRLVTPLTPHREGAPLVLVHPLGGTLHAYEPLLRLLPPTLPVLGLRSPAMAGAGQEPASVPELARRYATELVTHTRLPALALFGWSLGGHGALALAAELERRGIEVTSVDLWDCGIGDWEPDGDQEALRLALNATYGAGDTADRRRVLDLVPEGTVADEAALRRVLDLSGPPGDPDRDTLEHHFRTIRHQSDIFRGWRPDTCLRAPLHAVYASDSLRTAVVARTDWTPWTSGDWTEDTIEADHYSMMRPPRVVLAARGLLSRLHTRRTP